MRSTWPLRLFRGCTAIDHTRLHRRCASAGASLTVEDGDPDDGGGFGVRAGYGFNRRFTGFLEFDGVWFDVPNPQFGGYWGMVHADLGVRFNFANSLRRWVPFLEGAFGVRAVDVDEATYNGDFVDRLNFSGGALRWVVAFRSSPPRSWRSKR